MDKNEFLIRARFDKSTIRVYQAYPPTIAVPAVSMGRFVPPFKMSRMTWIKPSFNWMMYRSGYGTKPGQECILGIDIKREGLSWALENAVLSTFVQSVHSSESEWRRLSAESPVRIQWDPERDAKLEKIPSVRSIQIGLSGEAVRRYVHEWIIQIEDLTTLAHSLSDRYNTESIIDRPDNLEKTYPLDPAIVKRIVPSRG